MDSHRARHIAATVGSLGVLLTAGCGDGPAVPEAVVRVRLAPTAFCSFDVPGALATRPLGTNDHGDVVGLYIDQANLTHGFLLRGGCEGELATVDVPGAHTTFPRGINNRGDVAGRYTRPGSPIEHGYTMIDGVFATVDYPGAAQSALRFINDRGQIAGKYLDHAGVQHGFSLIDGAFATVDYPGARTSDLFAIANNGVAIGDWTEPVPPPVIVHGYRIDKKGIVTVADVPGYVGTLPRWLNERGDIVGIVIDGANVRHGYLMAKDGTVTLIDYPGATTTRTDVFGINSRGDVTGAYFVGSAEHGFLLTR
jgi:hypothetical protein